MVEGRWEKLVVPRGLCPRDVSMTFGPTLSPTPTSIFLSVSQEIGVDRGFSASALLTFQVGYSIVVGGCPQHCGVFISVPGLYRLDAHSTRPPPLHLVVMTKNTFRHCQMSPGEQNYVSPEHHYPADLRGSFQLSSSLFRR